MINVLHILPSLDPKAGGVSQAVRSMIRYSADPALSHEVLCLDDTEEEYLKDCDFVVYAIGRGKSAWNYNPRLLPWLLSHLADYNRIIVHGLWQYQTLAVYQAYRAVAKGIAKLYVMPHGMLDPYFQRAKDRKIKAIRNIVFWNLIERKLVNNADAVLFTCDVEKERASESFSRYNPKEEIVSGLGVERPPLFEKSMTTAFYKRCPDIKNRRYFLFLGRIHPKKGVDLMIRSYMKLRSSEHDLPLLIIAGPGLESQYGRKMKQLASETKDILFPGMLDGQSKWGAFYGCEAFILPSHQENFGIAVAEALACGKPVLISDQINICKEIETDGAGIVASNTLAGTYDLLRNWERLNVPEKQEYALNAKLCYESRYCESVAAKIILGIIK
jgi:glycosyltransferase involved in cell wall biosynthesis